jgi:hypothetical protein
MMKIITEAITRKQYLKFTHKNLLRIVQPHTYGLFSNNTDMLVAYQTGGKRDKGDLPGWGNYHPIDMHDVQILGETFPKAQPDYKKNDRRFRKIYSQL